MSIHEWARGDEHADAAEEFRAGEFHEGEASEEAVVNALRADGEGDAEEGEPVDDEQGDAEPHRDLDGPRQNFLGDAGVLLDHLGEVVQTGGEAHGDEHQEEVSADVHDDVGEDSHVGSEGGRHEGADGRAAG